MSKNVLSYSVDLTPYANNDVGPTRADLRSVERDEERRNDGRTLRRLPVGSPIGGRFFLKFYHHGRQRGCQQDEEDVRMACLLQYGDFLLHLFLRGKKLSTLSLA